MTTLHLRKSIGQSPLRPGFLLITLALTCFALSPAARAEDGDLGNGNTAEGSGALASLNLSTGATGNTAMGFDALFNNITSSNNTAEGDHALFSLSDGFNNTASGWSALQGNTHGYDNTAIGSAALQANTTGKSNIALGISAGANLTTGGNNIDIGNVGVAGESNNIRIGTVGTQKATFIAGISGVTIAGGVGVIVGTNGQLGTTTSSVRFKEAIKPMDKASEAILALRPGTFRYKHELDPEGIPQFGLVAEQVEKVNPDLVVRDAKGEVYTVRYDAVNAMLLNEFLKEHRKVQELEKDLRATVTQQQKEIKALSASLKEQTSQIQKVNDRLEVSKPAPQLVADNQ